MSTKAKFDISTLPWIPSECAQEPDREADLIIMNDFIDGATAYTAYQLSQARFAPAIGVAQQLKVQRSLQTYLAREKLLGGIVAIHGSREVARGNSCDPCLYGECFAESYEGGCRNARGLQSCAERGSGYEGGSGTSRLFDGKERRGSSQLGNLCSKPSARQALAP